MPVADDLKVYLRAETRAAVRAMQKAQKQTDSLSGQLGMMAKTAVKSFAGYVAAAASIGAVISTMKESINLYGEQIQAEQKLAASIRSTGGDVDELLPKYKRIASEIQGITTVGDEATLSLMQQARSLGVTDEQMEEATKGAIGLSKALGIGTQQALRGVANALNGEFTSLQRYIPELRTASTESEKMAIVQKAMADGFKVAKAEADNGYGSLQQLSNAAGDFKETMGRAVAEGIQPFVTGLTDWISSIATARTELMDLRDILNKRARGETLSLQEQIKLQESKVEKLRNELDTASKLKSNSESILGYQSDSREEIDAQLRGEENKLAILQRQLQAREEGNKAEQEQTQKELEMNETAATKRLEIRKKYGQKEFEAQANTFQKIEAERQRVLDEMAAAYVKSGHEVEVVNDWFDKQQEQAKRDLIARMDDISEEYRQREIARIKAEYEAEKQAAEERKRIAKQEFQEKMNYAMQYVSTIQSGFTSIATIQTNMYQKQIDAAEEGSEEQKKLMREQAKSQKKWATFQALINTATAVTKTFANIGAPWAAPLAAAQAAAGMAQVAAIRSQPLPAFGQGGDFIATKPQTIVVGEAGRERVRIDPQPDTRRDGILIQINGNIYGPGGAEEFAQYIVSAIKRGQRSGRVEALV